MTTLHAFRWGLALATFCILLVFTAPHHCHDGSGVWLE